MWTDSLFLCPRRGSGHRQSDREAGSDCGQAEGSVRGDQEEERGAARTVREHHGRGRISLRVQRKKSAERGFIRCVEQLVSLLFLAL